MICTRPTLSVVIPVYNCICTIAGCLESLLEQEHPGYEVLVVDDGSTDGTVGICESYPDVRIVSVKNGGPSKARNMGIKMARGEIIAFTDGDCIADRNWLSELEKGFVNPEVAGVGGNQKSPGDDTDFGKRVQDIFETLGFMTSYMKTETGMTGIGHNPSCNSAYRRCVLEEMGGFDENLWPGEDVDLDLKIQRRGYKLIRNPRAVVRHYRPGTYDGLARMMRRYGASAWHLFKRYGLFRPIHYEPIAAVSGLILIFALVTCAPKMLPLLFIPLAGIFLWFFLKKWDLARSIQLFALFLVILINWNWGFFTGHWYRPWAEKDV